MREDIINCLKLFSYILKNTEKAFRMNLTLSENIGQNDQFYISTDLIDSSFDLSFREVKGTVGRLRWNRVGNANYRLIHPVYDKRNRVVGHIFKALWTIGYTYHAVYSDHTKCFMIAASPVGGSRYDQLCFVEEGFWGVPLPKVQKTFTVSGYIALPEYFVTSGLLAFKLTNRGRRLAMVGKSGIIYVDVEYKQLYSKHDFGKSDNKTFDTLIAGSPVKYSVIAVAFSDFEGDDPLTGRAIWHHQIEIHDLEEQRLLGSYSLERNEKYRQFKNICFLESGKSLLIDFKEKIIRLEIK